MTYLNKSEAETENDSQPVVAVTGEKSTLLPPDYVPSVDEPFMNHFQQAYFRRLLLEWRESLLVESQQTLNQLQEVCFAESDAADRAALESEHAVELRTRDRERKLITKIDDALTRLNEGTYGYCEETGEPISLKRLIARPIASLSLEAQERHERLERSHRDD